MSQRTPAIVAQLRRVQALRSARDADPELRRRVDAIKQFQHARFRHDYGFLLSDSRYARAARFFLEELYAAEDFAQRDAEFERVIPWMARLLPDSVMATIADLIDLHALTEELDQQMADALPSAAVDNETYRAAWLVVDRRVDRGRQLALLLAVGRELDRHTRSKPLVATLRLMRRPAKASGLGRLQAFLETGMAAFAAMRGAQDFLRVIEANETRVIEALFENE